MKIIDLLNMIAEGKEVPKKIKLFDDIYIFDDYNAVYKNESTHCNLLDVYNGYVLNDKVEIIEDNGDKIEKIIIGNTKHEYIIEKINEIIDKINNME